MRGFLNDPLFFLVIFAAFMLILGAVIIPAWGDVADYDVKISEKKIQMANLDKLIDTKKEELRKAKNTISESWTAVADIEVAQKNLDDTIKNYESVQKEYLDLLRAKSDFIKQQKANEKAEFDAKAIKQASKKFEPRGLYKIIGIQLSKQCLTLIQNNFTTTCPTYKQLRSLDSSIQEVSGFFTVDEKKFYHREPSPYLESWRYYDTDPTIRIIVDPPSGMSDKIKLITIQNNFDTFTLPGQLTIPQEYEYVTYTKNSSSTAYNVTKAVNVTFKNQTQAWGMVLFHDRYVDEKCAKATVNADKWKLLIADTIEYMRHGCDEKFTSFVNKEIIPSKYTEQDITTTQKYKDEQYLKYVKEFCIFKFQSCK